MSLLRLTTYKISKLHITGPSYWEFTTNQWIPCIKGPLTHWGRVRHIYISNLTIIGSDNGLWPGRRQSIIWANVGILLIGHLGTNFNEILIKINNFWFKKIHFEMLSGKWRPSCLGLYVLMQKDISMTCHHDHEWLDSCNYRKYLQGMPSSWYRAYSRLVPSQWEMPLLCNGVSHWLGANLEWALW